MFSLSSMLAKVECSMSKKRPVESNSKKDAPKGTSRISAAASPLMVR